MSDATVRVSAITACGPDSTNEDSFALHGLPNAISNGRSVAARSDGLGIVCVVADGAAAVVNSNTGDDDKLEQLVERAVASGSRGDITVLLVRLCGANSRSHP